MNGPEPDNGSTMPRDDRPFTPALGTGPTRLYDLALRIFTRERIWRREVIRRLAPAAGERIIDVGCGTGTLPVAIAARQPAAQVFGLDPDSEALAIDAVKAGEAGVMIDWRRGFADEVAAQRPFNAVTCTLVLHQVPLAGKRDALEAIFAALKPNGRLVLADYSLQRSRIMRALFRATVQRIDGQEDTQPNADGVLPGLLADAGFVDIVESLVIPTPSGSISIFDGRKPRNGG